MKETNLNRQINTIYQNLIERLQSENNSPFFDSLLNSQSDFELKSIEDNRAIFVTGDSSTAQIIKASILPQLTKHLSELLECNVTVEIVDRNSYNKRSKLVEQANSSFFQNSYIQKQYTFENFVLGPNNRDAYLASLFSVENPARSNPIFLYSKSGLGKTHLLQAIGNAYKMKYPHAKVLYITSDDFITEFVKFSLGNKESESLKDFFNTIDLLLVDDIQFLAKKEGSQAMFFNVFNLLVSHEKQIVLTSDRSPSELKDLPDRLVSRFSGGLSISISSPNKDTLVEILKMKIKNSSLSVDIFEPEVLDYLAFNYGKNVRELEGSYNNLLFAITTRKPQGNINLEFAKEVFEADEKRRTKAGKIDIQNIIRIVAEYYNMTESQLKSKVRTSQIALARQIAMYLSRNILNTPYQEIGRQFGKDHTTVLANVSKISQNLSTDANLKKVIDELTNKIKASK
jgi:chromosomal replication initiator protein